MMRAFAGPLRVLPCALLMLTAPPAAWARQDWGAIPVSVTHVRGDVFAVFGTGANQSVAVGGGRLLVVDAGYAGLGERLLAEVRKATEGVAPGGRIAYLVDTHWHFDHVGANGVWAAAGATVIAHERTAALMAGDQTMPALDGRLVPATPPAARADLLFSSSLDLVWNEGIVEVVHAPGAHTAGDAVVYFRKADVAHVGDLFFNGMYPFIDVDHGGSLEGLVVACEEVLERTGASTLFIPGHGPLATRADFQRYTDMLRTVHGHLSEMVRRGLSRREVIAARPTADLDAAWSRGGGFNAPDVWVGMAYDGYRPARPEI